MQMIAISGDKGAGKTTALEHLATNLGGVVISYAQLKSMMPALKSGAVKLNIDTFVDDVPYTEDANAPELGGLNKLYDDSYRLYYVNVPGVV